jgi:hypothetical protein
MPVTVRIAFPLALISLLLLFVTPPTSRYLRLVNSDTMPRLRQPANAKKLAHGIPADQWARDWVPLEASQASRTLSLKEDRSRLVANGPVIQLGRKWFDLAATFNGWIMTFVVGLWAYILAMTVSRRLPSAPLPLALALCVYAIALYTELFPIITQPGIAPPLTQSGWNLRVWTSPLFIFIAALLASLVPFAGSDPRHTFFQRFLALFRDSSFFCLTLLSLAMLLLALQIQGLEKSLLP